MGTLTTHVLDTAQGKPAANVAFRLRRIAPQPEECFAGHTNQDGRVDQVLLAGETFVLGDYELQFDIGDYYADSPFKRDAAEFLTTVSVQFRLSRDEHYHVPLLVSPWSYSTYRGS